MYVMRKVFFASFIYLLILSTLNVQNVFAADTTIAPSPSKGSFNKPFSVNMVIDGHGDKFNAAQAKVNISSNLIVQNLTLGDCNFSFLHTPSIENPSFAGVIISTYSTKCTVYTLTLAPKEKGKAKINLSNVSIKRYGDAVNILSSVANGSYNLTGVTNTATGQINQVENTSTKGLYTLYLKVFSSGTTPVSDAIVTLNATSARNKHTGITDKIGTAHFSNLQSGVYDAVVTEKGSKVGETIINVNGTNHVLTLSINLSMQKNNPLMKSGFVLSQFESNPIFLGIILIIGIILGVCIVLVVLKFFKKTHLE
jgi:hypothetical protein